MKKIIFISLLMIFSKISLANTWEYTCLYHTEKDTILTLVVDYDKKIVKRWKSTIISNSGSQILNHMATKIKSNALIQEDGVHVALAIDRVNQMKFIFDPSVKGANFKLNELDKTVPVFDLTCGAEKI